jgi:hypothetical protein
MRSTMCRALLVKPLSQHLSIYLLSGFSLRYPSYHWVLGISYFKTSKLSSRQPLLQASEYALALET